MSLSLSIVIPNYNGLKLLQKHIPSVVKFARRAEIIVVDDASSDDSVSWLTKNFPRIKVLKLGKNHGFVGAVNAGFKQAKGELVLLLNSDVSLTEDTITCLKAHFKDPKVFAVGAKEVIKGRADRGKSVGTFARGLLVHSRANKLDFGPTLWVFGASGMFRKSVWQKLKGMDELFKPAYWEDIDISYRAWKAGYTLLFEPNAIVHHDAESTMNPTLGDKKSVYAFKNQILFFWKNVTDTNLWMQHVVWLPYHLVVTNIRTKGAFGKGFIAALNQANRGLNRNPRVKSRRKDHEIIQIVTS